MFRWCKNLREKWSGSAETENFSWCSAQRWERLIALKSESGTWHQEWLKLSTQNILSLALSFGLESPRRWLSFPVVKKKTKNKVMKNRQEQKGAQLVRVGGFLLCELCKFGFQSYYLSPQSLWVLVIHSQVNISFTFLDLMVFWRCCGLGKRIVKREWKAAAWLCFWICI